MSIIATLLGWTKLPQWALELGLLAALGIGFAIYHHHVLEEGVQAQQKADAAASAKVEAQAAAATRAAQDAANKAAESYHAEITADAARAAAAPIAPVELCDSTPYGSGGGMPEAGATIPGNAGGGTTAGSVPGVPAGNPGVRAQPSHDISGLLGAWADRADTVSAELREYQGRQP